MVFEACQRYTYDVPEEQQDIRLDVFLASCLPEFSRSRIQSLIRGGETEINSLSVNKPGHKLKSGDHVSLVIPEVEALDLTPEAVDFDTLFEDAFLLVLNKPAGIVVHPAPGHLSGTLVHGLLRHCRDLSGIGGVGRPGIVHRLDKDTSGVMVVAKTDAAHQGLSRQFKDGLIEKEYLALVHGPVRENAGHVDAAIARHRQKRKEMCVSTSGGKHALTFWKRIETFPMGLALLSVRIKTGRTHQIRVHLSHLGYPVVGDSVYGRGPAGWKRLWVKEKVQPPAVDRQMLHAFRMKLVHPIGGDRMVFEAPLPGDMAGVLAALRQLADHT